MKACKISWITILIVAFLALPGTGRAVEVAPRITDREIIESLAAIRGDIKRLDQRFEAMETQINQRFEAVDQRFEAIDQRFEAVNQRFEGITQQISELKSFMLWGFGILFAGMFSLVGFVLWDRRTALAPAVSKYSALEEREEKLEKVLKEMAQTDPRAAEALRHVGLL